MRTALRHAKAAVCCLVALIATSATAASPYDLEVVAHDTPGTMQQRESAEVRVVLANRGSKTWDPARAFNVSYRWTAPDGDALVADGERTPLPRAVPPGATIELRVRLVAPRATGVALLRWDVVEESVTWISERDPTPASPIRVTIRPAVVGHAFTVLQAETPRFVMASASRKVRLVVRNDGLEAWTAGKPIHLSYHWIHRNPRKDHYDGERSALPRPVPQGGSTAIDARLFAPSAPGVYRLQWDMVEEGVTWFSERDPSPELATLVIVLPQITRAAAAVIVALGSLVLVLVARRSPSRRGLATLVALLDLVVLGVALLAKQAALAAELNPEGRVLGALAAGTVVFLVIAIAFVPARVRPWAAVLANAGGTIVIFADLLHFRFFGDVISFAATQSGVQLTDVVASVVSLVRSRDLWLFADLPVACVLAVMLAGPLRLSGARPARVFACLLLPLLDRKSVV